jgi:hypothetical protein
MEAGQVIAQSEKHHNRRAGVNELLCRYATSSIFAAGLAFSCGVDGAGFRFF